jgi:CheY-like chemotaxis protein
MNERAKLLLVDDEPEILVALQDLFEHDYELTALTSPQAALDDLKAGGEYALIISDQRMPDMTGDVFLTHARELSDAAAILLTGYADLTAVTEALNRGGIVGYTAKPWEPGALRAMVAGAVEQRRLRRALEAERALLAGLMEAGPTAIAFKDADGRLLQVNGAKAAQLELAPADCIGPHRARARRPGPSARRAGGAVGRPGAPAGGRAHRRRRADLDARGLCADHRRPRRQRQAGGGGT